jgi:hypothetical protein
VHWKIPSVLIILLLLSELYLSARCCCNAIADAAVSAVPAAAAASNFQELLDRHKRVRQERIALLRAAAWRRISCESAGSTAFQQALPACCS